MMSRLASIFDGSPQRSPLSMGERSDVSEGGGRWKEPMALFDFHGGGCIERS